MKPFSLSLTNASDINNTDLESSYTLPSSSFIPSSPPPTYAKANQITSTTRSNHSHESLHDLHDEDIHLVNVIRWICQCEWRFVVVIMINTTVMFSRLTRIHETIYLDQFMVEAFFAIFPLFLIWIFTTLRENYRSWAPTVETQRYWLWFVLLALWITYCALLYSAPWRYEYSAMFILTVR